MPSLLLAAAQATTTATPRLLQGGLPPWVKIALAVLAVLGAILLIRAISRMNKVVLIFVFGVGLPVLFFYALYNRKEPEFLKPVFDYLSLFFPTKEFERKDAGK